MAVQQQRASRSNRLADQIRADSPWGFWKCNDVGGDESSGGNVLIADYSGNNRDADTWVGNTGFNEFLFRVRPLVPSAPDDYSIRFTTGMGYETSAFYSNANAKTFAVECWVISLVAGIAGIIGGDDSGGHRVFQFRRNGAGGIDLILFDNVGGTFAASSSRSISDGQPHHIAGTYDGAKIRVFVDGIEDGSANSTASMTTGNTLVGLGVQLNVAGFGGWISYAAIYQGTLSPDRVLAHYVAGVTPESSPLSISGPRLRMILPPKPYQPRNPGINHQNPALV